MFSYIVLYIIYFIWKIYPIVFVGHWLHILHGWNYLLKLSIHPFSSPESPYGSRGRATDGERQGTGWIGLGLQAR